MAKKITAVVRLQIPAGRHDAGPVAAHALGRRGVNLAAFNRSFALVVDTPSGDAVREPAPTV